mgnify:FL=1
MSEKWDRSIKGDFKAAHDGKAVPGAGDQPKAPATPFKDSGHDSFGSHTPKNSQRPAPSPSGPGPTPGGGALSAGVSDRWAASRQQGPAKTKDQSLSQEFNRKSR